MAQCKAITNSGEQCKREALDNGYCSLPAHQAQAEEPLEEQEDLCGHVNVHAGEQEDENFLTCDKPKGHTGDHSAIYHEVVWKKGSIISEEDKRTYWNDDAGIPVDEIEPEEQIKTKSDISRIVERLMREAEK